MAELRDRGFIVCKVEQRLPIPGKFITKDAFGFGDLLIAGEGYGIALVQVTSTSNLSARQKKALAIPELRKWLTCKGKLLLHGWAKRGPRGARKTWTLVEREITLSDFQNKNESETYGEPSAAD